MGSSLGRLGRRVALISVSGAAYAAFQAAAIVIVTRAGGAESSGRIILAQAVATPLAFAAGLGLREILATDARGNWPIANAVRLQLTASLLICLVTYSLLHLTVGSEMGSLIVLVLLAKCGEQFSFTAHGAFLRHMRYRWVARSTLTRGAVMPAAFSLMLVGASLTQAAGAMAGAQAILALRDLQLANRNDHFSFHGTGAYRDSQKSMQGDICAVAPVAAHSVVQLGFLSAIRFVVAGRGSLSDLAVFGLVATSMRAVQIVVRAISSVVMPETGQMIATRQIDVLGKRLFWLSVSTIAAAAPVALLAAAVGPLLLATATGLVAPPLLFAMVAVSAGAMLVASLYSHASIASGVGWALPLLSIVPIGVGIACVHTLYPHFGVNAGGVGLAAGSFARAAINARLFQALHPGRVEADTDERDS